MKATLTICIVNSLLFFIPGCHGQTPSPTRKFTNPPRAEPWDGVQDHQHRPKPLNASTPPPSNFPTSFPTAPPTLTAHATSGPVNSPRAEPTDGVPDHQQRPLPFDKSTSAPLLVTVPPTFAPVKKGRNPPRPPGYTIKPRGSTLLPISDPTASPSLSPIPCFCETSTVLTKDKGVTAMKDLKLGDLVLNAFGKYDAVYSFAHYSPNVKAGVIQIHTAGLKTSLEISEEHMLFVEGGKAVPAGVVSVGDKVSLANGELAQVTKIRKVIRRGMYAPYTKSGTIVVNGVAASCYIDLQHRHINSAGIVFIGQFKTPLSVHFTRHVREAPHRLICRFAGSYCETETYNKNGHSAWVEKPNVLGKWLIKQNAVVASLIFVPLFTVTFMFYAIEWMLTSNNGYYQSMLLLLIAVASLYMLGVVPINKKKRAKKQV